ncbi:ATP-binding cassette domain-containing protein [uncultured Desulfobacter sp.]|uniref:ABC transporter ATP-binding protein n=1 Tax=uncultured Desulfobacter sp. TaxID=240139 RepID=UPI002AAAC8D3|nr:ATP-binding cassette domain-containing protein [uncultured Desulfobacter sp.]
MSHLIAENLVSRFVSVDRLEIEKGELMVLIGPSGAGKSSLLNVLAGFIPHTGQIILGGRAVHTLPPHRRKIGYLFQDLYLFPHMTVFQNLKIAMQNQKLKKHRVMEEINTLLELFRITDLARSYPGQISGGEKQRVAMARSMASKPDLLLLDEPLSHLDYMTAQYLRAQFKRVQQQFGLTTLFVTHDLGEAQDLGDRIVVMEKGHLRLPGQDSDPVKEQIFSMPQNLPDNFFQEPFAV